MDWGMQNRFNSLFNKKSGKTIFYAIDHGYFMGPTSGIEDISKAAEPLMPYLDVLMLTRGALRNGINAKMRKPVALRVSSGTSILNDDLLHEGLSVSVEEAIRLNTTIAAFSITVGAPLSERDTILDYSALIDEAERFGLPTLAVTAVGRGLERDARYLSLATRMAGELGARMVKTYFCEGFERVVETSLVPVVIAGGKKIPEKDALQMAKNALIAGAVGIDMGRNIFQSEDPVAMMRAVNGLVHDGLSVNDAFALFEDVKNS